MKFAIFRRCPVTVTTLTLTLPRGGVRRRNIREVDHGQGKRNPDTGREPGAETGGGDQDHDRRRGGTEIETGTEGGRGLEIEGRDLSPLRGPERM